MTDCSAGFGGSYMEVVDTSDGPSTNSLALHRAPKRGKLPALCWLMLPSTAFSYC